MNIITIGTGFVGASHSAVLASHGHKVTAYDINTQKISDLSSKDQRKIDACLYEPGLAHLLQTHKINFTASFEELKQAVETVDVIFMCLPTPAEELEKPEEQRFLFIAAKQLSELLKTRNNGKQDKYILIVNKSTVPIGTAKSLHNKLTEWGVKNFNTASNPEFLVEGKAILGSQNPDRVVIGINSEKDEQLLRQVYQNIAGEKIKTMKPGDAESTKLLSNFELFSRIVQNFHIAGRLCEEIPELNYENIINGITSDVRLPKWGHYVSLYSGGSCFEKDALNLLKTLNSLMGTEYSKQYVKLVVEGNDAQLKRFYERAKQAKFDFSEKKVALLGTAFKQDTNDVRMSPSTIITNWLLKDGVSEIRAYDPQANENYKKMYPDKKITTHKTAEEAITGTDATIICTDWPEFKFIAPLFNDKKNYLIMDGRRSLAKHYDELAKNGKIIIAVGSPTIGKF